MSRIERFGLSAQLPSLSPSCSCNVNMSVSSVLLILDVQDPWSCPSDGEVPRGSLLGGLCGNGERGGDAGSRSKQTDQSQSIGSLWLVVFDGPGGGNVGVGIGVSGIALLGESSGDLGWFLSLRRSSFWVTVTAGF